LPSYSILVPLYREGNVVDTLVRHLSQIDYPRDRLELFILVEEEDCDTLAALARTTLPPWFLIIRVPAGMPRTKPRALNAALPFCTGEFLVVFDAEDAPEPDQLLRAAARFRTVPDEVACLQARLCISNTYDGFLTRRFAIDYCTLFDCLKAGAARAGWPVPLGGSSNHFRTSILKQVGGWDAWNVTEDADLGIRLARFGWQVEDLASTTWEEAPNSLAAWMNQRTRWMKGWMQTVAVQLRTPVDFVAALGPFRAMILASTAFAVLIGACFYPLFLAAIAMRLLDPVPFGDGGALMALADAMIIILLILSFTVEFVPAVIALRRRKALSLVPFVFLAPVTHLLVSFALWRAVIDLVRRPYHWHKTMHGKALHEERLGSIRD
jgi:glycosyltransferase XagB